MRKEKITGQRGSWFARAGDKRMPIMWADEIRGKILCTDWVETAREHTANKRQELIDYFEPNLNAETNIIVANAINTKVRPRSIDGYVAVFRVRVLGVEPEIELQLLERIADSKK
jgi:hypothetical protein